MSVQKKTQFSWLSHLFSSRLNWVFFFLSITISSYATEPEEEPTFITDNPLTELSRDRNSPINTTAFKPRQGDTDWAEFFRNVHGSYGLSFMGPRIAGSGNETYNIFIPDIAPVQLSHFWQLGVQVNPDLQLGMNVSAIQNIAENITGSTGVVRGRNFDVYDPTLYANFPNLIQIPNWFVFTSVSMSLSLTDFSKSIGRITQITASQSWTYSSPGSDWSFGANTQIQPTFYSDPMPAGFTFRKTLYASVGHLVSYRISPVLNVQSTSTFDLDHRSPDPEGAFHFTSNLDDTSRISLYLSPTIGRNLFLTLGGYVQFLVWKPAAETSILGMDFSISF